MQSDDLIGILNGVDTEDWDPATDRLIPHHYDASSLEAKWRNKEDLLHTVLGPQRDSPRPAVGGGVERPVPRLLAHVQRRRLGSTGHKDPLLGFGPE